jgi:hypothetical protein
MNVAEEKTHRGDLVSGALRLTRAERRAYRRTCQLSDN